jgi:glucose/arabinose dehydrogenase
MRRLLVLGILGIVAAAALAAGRSSGAPQPGYSFRPLVSGFGELTGAAAPKSSNDLYVVERTGKVWVLLNGTHKRPDPFADFGGIIDSSLDDNGLLSITFSPNYASNHLLYIDYTDGASSGNIRVDEFRSDGTHVIMSSRRHILAVFDPIEDHFGGQLQFGADGKLYVSVGDGGCCGDPLGSAQPMNTFLGKLLRTGNPTAATPTWEIVANGLRNPWRFSFDRANGDLYLADVGQDAWEEVDYRPRAALNANFGWSRYEGNHDYNTGMALRGPFPLVFPIAEYSHSQGCAITGGYVYRGIQAASALGRYFYADFCNGTFWSLAVVNGHASAPRQESFNVPLPTSFGEDAHGELYVVNLLGQVYKLSRL